MEIKFSVVSLFLYNKFKLEKFEKTPGEVLDDLISIDNDEA